MKVNGLAVAIFILGISVGFLMRPYAMLPNFFSTSAKLAVSQMKSGDMYAARENLEGKIDSLDDTALKILINMYATGEGGQVDEPKAIATMERLRCHEGEPGSTSFSLYESFAHLGVNRKRAVFWLKRSAESGNKKAIGLLANPDTRKELEINGESYDSGYWDNRTKSDFDKLLAASPMKCW
jgi:hypothetical protein